MSTKLLNGDDRPSAAALSQMVIGAAMYPGVRYAAYQNHDLGSEHLGHLRFLAVGPNNTFKAQPLHFPDTQSEIGWRYVFVGWVNLETGEITES